MKPALALLLCALALLAGGCDYPEAGFYEVSAADKGKYIASFPFMVEELTDDTDLTIGFNLLLPRAGELVLVPLKNSEDLSRRGWDLRIGSGDFGYGDLQLSLVHANEQLTFYGTQRDPQASQSELFRGKNLHDFVGKVEMDGDEPARMVFESNLPDSLLEGRSNSAKWTIKRISQAQFEKSLGRKVADASRREAPYMSPLREQPVVPTVKKEVPAKTLRPGKYKRSNPGGGRQPGP